MSHSHPDESDVIEYMDTLCQSAIGSARPYGKLATKAIFLTSSAHSVCQPRPGLGRRLRHLSQKLSRQTCPGQRVAAHIPHTQQPSALQACAWACDGKLGKFAMSYRSMEDAHTCMVARAQMHSAHVRDASIAMI